MFNGTRKGKMRARKDWTQVIESVFMKIKQQTLEEAQ